MNHRGFDTWTFGEHEHPYKKTLYDMCKALAPSMNGYKTLLLDVPVRYMEDERTFATFKSDPAAVNMITLLHLFIHLHAQVCQHGAPNIVGWLQRTRTIDGEATYSWMVVWVATSEAVDNMHGALADLFMMAEHRGRGRPLPKVPPPKSTFLLNLTAGRFVELLTWYTNAKRALYEATHEEATMTIQSVLVPVTQYKLPHNMALDKAFSPSTLYYNVRNDPLRRRIASVQYYDVACYSVSPQDGHQVGFRDPYNAWFIATRRWTSAMLQTYLPTDDETTNAARVLRLARDIGETDLDYVGRISRVVGQPATDRDAIIRYSGNNQYVDFQMSYLVHSPTVDEEIGRIYHETLALGDVAGLRARLMQWKTQNGMAIFNHCWNAVNPTAPNADRAVIEYLHDYSESLRYVNWLERREETEEQRRKQPRPITVPPTQPKEIMLASYDHVRAHYTFDPRLSYFANTRAKFFMDLEIGPNVLVAHGLIHMLMLSSLFASFVMRTNVLYQNVLLSGHQATSKSFALNVMRLCMIKGTYLSMTDFTEKLFSTFKVDLPGMVWVFEELKAEMLGINSDNGKANEHNQLCTTMKALACDPFIQYAETVMVGTDNNRKAADGNNGGPNTDYAGSEAAAAADTRRMTFRRIPGMVTIMCGANRGVENADKATLSRYVNFQMCNGERADYRTQKGLAMMADKDLWATNPHTRQLAARMQFVQACVFMFNRESSLGEKRPLARRPDMTIAHAMIGRAIRYLDDMGISLPDSRVTSSLEKFAQMLTVWHAVDMVFCNPALEETFKRPPTPEMILRLEAYVVCTEDIAFFTIGMCMNLFVPPSVRQLQTYLKHYFTTERRRQFPPAIDDRRLRDPNFYVYPFPLRRLLAETIAYAKDKSVSVHDMARELDLLQSSRELSDPFFLHEDHVRAQYDAHMAGAMAEEAIWSTFRDRQQNEDRQTAKVKYLRLFVPTTAAQGGGGGSSAAGADSQQVAISRFFVENLNFDNLVGDTIRACFFKGIRTTRTSDPASGPRYVLSGEAKPGYPYLLQKIQVTDEGAEELIIDRKLLNPAGFRAPDETARLSFSDTSNPHIKLPAGCDYEELVVMNHLHQLGITQVTAPTYPFLQVPARFEAYWDTVLADPKYDVYRDRTPGPRGAPKAYPEDYQRSVAAAAADAAAMPPPPRRIFPAGGSANIDGEFAVSAPQPRGDAGDAQSGAETGAGLTNAGINAFMKCWDRIDSREPDLSYALCYAFWKSSMGTYTFRDPLAVEADPDYAPSEYGAYSVMGRINNNNNNDDTVSTSSRASRRSAASSAPPPVQISEEDVPPGAGVGSMVVGIYDASDQ